MCATPSRCACSPRSVVASWPRACASRTKAQPVRQPVDYSTPADADRCDWLDEAVCLQPWPNDYFTTGDSGTTTHRRLNLQLLSMPRNRAGKPIDPTDYNRNDGFSPGTPIVTKIPGLDTKAAFDRSGIVPITDMGR